MYDVKQKAVYYQAIAILGDVLTRNGSPSIEKNAIDAGVPFVVIF
ncbi:MAG: hypothetical protein V7L11_32960 [Nostoc sp.]